MVWCGAVAVEWAVDVFDFVMRIRLVTAARQS